MMGTGKLMYEFEKQKAQVILMKRISYTTDYKLSLNEVAHWFGLEKNIHKEKWNNNKREFRRTLILGTKLKEQPKKKVNKWKTDVEH